jgi:hypothetical protein
MVIFHCHVVGRFLLCHDMPLFKNFRKRFAHSLASPKHTCIHPVQCVPDYLSSNKSIHSCTAYTVVCSSERFPAGQKLRTTSLRRKQRGGWGRHLLTSAEIGCSEVFTPRRDNTDLMNQVTTSQSRRLANPSGWHYRSRPLVSLVPSCQSLWGAGTWPLASNVWRCRCQVISTASGKDTSLVSVPLSSDWQRDIQQADRDNRTMYTVYTQYTN